MKEINKKAIKDLSIFTLMLMLQTVMFFILMLLCLSLNPQSIYSYLIILGVLFIFMFTSLFMTKKFISYLRREDENLK